MEQQEFRTQADIFRDRDVQIGAAVGLIVGLLLGWFVLGWWIAPVQWVDAEPGDLHPDWQNHYVAMVADSYLVTGDAQIARDRLKGFGEETLERVFGDVEATFERQGAARQAQAIRQLADQMGISIVPPGTPAAAEVTEGEEAAVETTVPETSASAVREGGTRSVWQVLLLALVIMVAIVAGVGGIMWFQRRSSMQFEGVEGTSRPPRVQDLPIESMNVGERKIVEYLDDGPGYEQTIQIFRGDKIIGSCGLKAVPTLSESGHVVACTAWLYEPETPDLAADTRVLISRRVYENAPLRNSLIGDLDPRNAIPAEPGQMAQLEHEALEMALRVLDVDYADIAEQYISRLVVEFEPATKRGEPEEPTAPVDFS